jgi:TonB family protein
MPRILPAGLTRRGIALSVLCGLAAPAWAIEGAGLSGGDLPSATARDASGSLFDFDIPAQPLAAALQKYSILVDIPIVFSSDMVRGRRSSALQGHYSSEAALRQLLDNTGLTAERQDSGIGATLLLRESVQSQPGAEPDPALPGSAVARLFGQAGYPGLLQRRIWQALCANPGTAPGQYRLLFRFQVDADGRLAGTRLLVSTGNPRRDAAVLDTLQRIQVDSPPPAIVQHPLTMSLLPDDPDTTPRCDSGAL